MLPSGEWLCFACQLFWLIPLKGRFLCPLGLREGFLYHLGFSSRVSSAHFCLFTVMCNWLRAAATCLLHSSFIDIKSALTMSTVKHCGMHWLPKWLHCFSNFRSYCFKKTGYLDGKIWTLKANGLTSPLIVTVTVKKTVNCCCSGFPVSGGI